MGVVAIVLLAAGVAVKHDGTPLRAGCEGSGAVATVQAGTPAEVRFSMTGDRGTCYKVSVTVGGKLLDGYVYASELTGTDEYEKGVRSAPQLVPSPSSAPQGAKGEVKNRTPAGGRSVNPLVQASALLDQKQPAAALETVESGMKMYGRTYELLVLAGIAAERSDQPKLALDYLQEAEQHRQDHSIQQLIARLQQEIAGDRSNEKLYGHRFLLRYEGGTLDPEIARSMVTLLESEYSRIAAELGCRAEERITTIVQSRAAYRATSNVAEWAGGHFDGSRIHIPVAESSAVSAATREAFSHELVHACLASLGNWPAWLHEGFAQKLSGKTASSSSLRKIQSMLKNNRLPRLTNMSQSWTRMSGEHAAIAYEYSLVAVEMLQELYRNYGIQNVLRAPERVSEVTDQIDKYLAR